MKKYFLGAAVAGLALTSIASGQVVMDFQDLESSGTGFVDHGYVYTDPTGAWMVSHPNSEPFQFTTAQTGNTSFYQGSTMLFNNTVNGVITFERVDGASFDLASIDLAALFVGGGAPTVNFVGNLAGGGTVNASYTVQNSRGIETFSFAGLGFNNLSSVVWVQENSLHQFDNIAVVPVPAPAGLALLGLGGLAATRRRRSV